MSVPFAIQRLDHVVLRADDPARLIRFYCEVLGCRVEREVAAVGLTQLRAGASLIDIIAGDRSQAGRNVDHFCLRVEPFDGDALRAYLAGVGVPASEVRRVYGAEGTGPSVYLEDPEGNTVELKGPAERAA